jgi:ribosomal protein L7/L12
MLDIAETGNGGAVADLSKLVNELSELAVLETGKLTKILEEKWGVNATGFASEFDVTTFEGWLSQI